MRRILSIILIISICLITAISFATDGTKEVEGLEKLEQQKEEMQNQINEAEQQIQEIDTELSENLQQLAKIDSSIQTTQETLKELNQTIENVQNEINTISVELEKATTEYNSKRELLEQRLVAIYQSGDTQYLDVLLKSNSISDFISSYFLITQLVEYDTNLLDVVEKQKNELEIKSTQLTGKQEYLKTQKQIQLKTETVLENTKTLRNNVTERLSKKEQEIQAKIDEYYKQIQEVENEIVSLAKTASFGESYVGGTMNWPIPNVYRITSNYGMRTHPITGVYKLHTGIDIGAKMGTDFLAAAHGIVTKAGMNSAYGNMVIIDHGGGVQTLYAHGSSIEVEVGQVVNAGDVVLKVGSTGYSTGPHAHFEIRINGETVNPLDYVAIPNSN